LLTINLDPRSGKAWRADNSGDRLTLYPSVWRQEGCRAHFIVWRDALLWCDGTAYNVDLDDGTLETVKATLREAEGHPLHYHEIAELALIHPWEALWACQRLQRHGFAAARDHFSYAALPPNQGSSEAQ
jgi:hypothetical protein